MLQYLPQFIPDALWVYDPAKIADIHANADGTGANPVAINDPVRHVLNQVAGGPPLTHATGCRWHPTAFNGQPWFKFDAAQILSTAAMFAAKHERAITIVMNVISTNAVGVPVIFSNNTASLWLAEFAGQKSWQKPGGAFNLGNPAPGVPELISITYDGRYFSPVVSQDGYRRDATAGGFYNVGQEIQNDMGINGTGITLGAIGGGGNNMSGFIGKHVGIGRALHGSELGDLLGYMGDSDGGNASGDWIEFCGDSIFDGTAIAAGQDTRIAANNVCEMIYQAVVARGYPCSRVRDAYPGRIGANWLAEAGRRNHPFAWRGLSNKSVACIEFFHNDLMGYGVDTTIARNREICKRQKQMGKTPILFYPLPSARPGFEALRQTYTAALDVIQASADPIAPAVVRWDRNPVMGALAAASNPALFQEPPANPGIHPTALGNTYLVEEPAQVIIDVLTGKIPSPDTVRDYVRNSYLTSQELEIG